MRTQVEERLQKCPWIDQSVGAAAKFLNIRHLCSWDFPLHLWMRVPTPALAKVTFLTHGSPLLDQSHFWPAPRQRWSWQCTTKCWDQRHWPVYQNCQLPPRPTDLISKSSQETVEGKAPICGYSDAKKTTVSHIPSQWPPYRGMAKPPDVLNLHPNLWRITE